MIVSWIFITVICVGLGALPILFFIGRMHEIEDYIHSTFYFLPEDHRKSFKDIEKSFMGAFYLGIIFYTISIAMICVICFYKVFSEQEMLVIL
jgi:hypothetical protein